MKLVIVRLSKWLCRNHSNLQATIFPRIKRWSTRPSPTIKILMRVLVPPLSCPTYPKQASSTNPPLNFPNHQPIAEIHRRKLHKIPRQAQCREAHDSRIKVRLASRARLGRTRSNSAPVSRSLACRVRHASDGTGACSMRGTVR